MTKIIIFVCLNKVFMAIKGIISKYGRWIIAIAAAALAWSCSPFPEDDLYPDTTHNDRNGSKHYPDRISDGCRKNVFIVYSMGYNNLSSDLKADINEMLTGYVPGFHPYDDAVLILNHSTAGSGDYKTPTSPVLYKAYTAGDGTLTRDTLIVYPEGSAAASKDMMHDALTYIKETFPAEHYGMLISSHATGWAPELYCYKVPDKSVSGLYRALGLDFKPLEKYTDLHPFTKSIGAHFDGRPSNSREIELTDFASAVPFHLDYLIFDCCLMGGIEVAYELKDKCDKICFSQTEILSGGMDYKNLLSYVLEGEEPDIESFAFDYYKMYAEHPNSGYRYATVSVVDCRYIDGLVDVVARNAGLITTLSKSSRRSGVQQYFQPNNSRPHGLFFDLEDIVIKAGASEADLAELKKALEACVISKHATEYFLGGLKIDHHCGLSMYLPDWDREIVNEHYKTLKWNRATGLITDNELL